MNRKQALNLEKLTIILRTNEALTRELLKIERTLHRHAEAIANGDIVEDDNGKTYRVYRTWKGEIHKEPCRNMQGAALKRLTRIAKETGLTFYVQTDPRGCSLYAFTPAILEEMNQRGTTMSESYYPYGIAITI